MKNLCPNCGAHDNEPDARFCMACGCKLGSSLFFPPAPPRPRVLPDTVSGRFVINALLWTAPTYNAYSVGLIDGRLGSHTVIEQPLSLGDPFARVGEIAGKPIDLTGKNGELNAR